MCTGLFLDLARAGWVQVQHIWGRVNRPTGMCSSKYSSLERNNFLVSAENVVRLTPPQTSERAAMNYTLQEPVSIQWL